MGKQVSQNLRYIVAVAFLSDLYKHHLIDDDDYCALETKYADRFLPLFRYEKPCKNATLPIRQTGREGRNRIGTYHYKNQSNKIKNTEA